MIIDIISIASGLVSIGLAIYAIHFAKKESTQSAENYNKTKDLLKEIERKTELIDRGIQFEQKHLMSIVNKLFDLVGKEPVVMEPISIEEIHEIIDGKSAAAQQKMAQLEATINSMPKIRVGTELPKDLKEGEVFLQYE